MFKHSDKHVLIKIYLKRHRTERERERERERGERERDFKDNLFKQSD